MDVFETDWIEMAKNTVPVASISSLVLLDLWNVALSIITTCSGCNIGASIYSTQALNTAVFVYPLKRMGAFSFFSPYPDISVVRPTRRPGISAYSRSPRFVLPCVRTKCSSILVSSTQIMFSGGISRTTASKVARSTSSRS